MRFINLRIDNKEHIYQGEKNVEKNLYTLKLDTFSYLKVQALEYKYVYKNKETMVLQKPPLQRQKTKKTQI